MLGPRDDLSIDRFRSSVRSSRAVKLAVRAGTKVDCSTCQVGRASGVGAGQFCPFIERKIRVGELIYRAGDDAARVWFVRSGTVVLSRSPSEGDGSDERARAVRFAGSFLGLEALVAPSYIDTARASSNVSLCGATVQGVDVWLGPRGTPARTALELTLKSASQDRPRASASDGNAISRFARWLLEDVPRDVPLQLPRRAVAELLGMRPETLSRSIATLSERGAIASTRTSLRIIDESLLAAAVERPAQPL